MPPIRRDYNLSDKLTEFIVIGMDYRVPEIVAYLNHVQDDYVFTDQQVRSYFEYYLSPRGPFTKRKAGKVVYYTLNGFF